MSLSPNCVSRKNNTHPVYIQEDLFDSLVMKVRKFFTRILPALFLLIFALILLFPNMTMKGEKGESPVTTAYETINMSDSTNPKDNSVALKNFKVLTYNVWFDSFEFNSRMQCIIDQTLELQPDVCCFQEVLPAFAAMLQDHTELNKLYVMSPFTASSYGTMTLARREVSPRFDTIEFPSHMGRSLLKTVCVVNGSSIAIGNVHLESLGNEKLRRKQLIICEDALKRYSSSILVGDFNFCSERNFHIVPNAPLENDVLQQVLPSYVDVWPSLHQSLLHGEQAVGYTFDSEVNKMFTKNERMRYDRVMARCVQGGGDAAGEGGGLVAPSEIALVGVQALQTAAGEPRVWPSDHFGLLVSFQLARSDALS